MFEETITKLSQNFARQIGLQFVGRYVKISYGNMLSNEKNKQWTRIVLLYHGLRWMEATFKAKVENKLPHIVLHDSSIPFGKGDRRG